MADEPRALKPSVLTLAEASERLTSPDAGEEYSAACGQPWLAVRVEGEHDEAKLAGLREALPTFACPTIGIVGDGEAPAAQAVARAFDVVIDSDEDLSRLRGSIERSPIAACALVQLLRANETRSIEDALVAESFAYSTLQAGPEFAAWLACRPTLRPEIPSEPPVLVERAGARLDLVLNHASKRNAYSAAMRDALCAGLQLAVADDSIEQVVLRGQGVAFCAGGDLDEFGLLVDPATAHTIRTTRSAARLLAAISGRVRAELHGACIGAGIELPAFASRVTASDDAFFELPEVGMGLVPGAGGTVSIPRRIGRQRAARWMLSGRRLDLETAQDWQLVDSAPVPGLEGRSGRRGP